MCTIVFVENFPYTGYQKISLVAITVKGSPGIDEFYRLLKYQYKKLLYIKNILIKQHGCQINICFVKKRTTFTE